VESFEFISRAQGRGQKASCSGDCSQLGAVGLDSFSLSILNILEHQVLDETFSGRHFLLGMFRNELSGWIGWKALFTAMFA
jgi:hypothetical protein